MPASTLVCVGGFFDLQGSFGRAIGCACRLLAQMKYRPWNGVFLSDEYLSGIDAAEDITASILKLYHQYGVKPLIESNISSTAELRRCHEMLERAGGEV